MLAFVDVAGIEVETIQQRTEATSSRGSKTVRVPCQRHRHNADSSLLINSKDEAKEVKLPACLELARIDHRWPMAISYGKTLA
jgi:hypothetical protein